ncbi:fused response regulator/phosphatase [Pseudoalteromonas fuliginea]|uniref:Response regulator n=1 Tax=Pseudoalteromonas fuliginea TaxID=1872678 RepID=A0ABQ6RIA4_9GAMM|nr:fused response regulator/phosphatase [Pseudoalteromonas fuliginea]KAA1156602.1 response regulator [Pseudoalteromonas fuliginea]KAA1167431.1 response regulator [Pseudoalteromonas fuliginea]
MIHVLIVDDQALNRILLSKMLEEDGYKISMAYNGLEALKVLETQDIDIILLDVIMPVMDGFEAAQKIKQRFDEVYLPIIFITSLDDQGSFERCLEVGGDDFIQKPFEKVILHAKIKAHSRTRQLSKKANQQKELLQYHHNQNEREHEIIEHIFNNSLENQDKFKDHLDFNLSPASMFNGDMFLVAQSPIGNLYCMLGDFTGHGLAAAIGALPASRAFYRMVSKGMAVNDVASEINTLLYNLLPGHMFCAATIIELSSSGKSISAWLGGLPDAYLIDQNGDVKQVLESQHMALGILDEDEFEHEVIHFETDHETRLAFATDGIIETTNKNDVFFGEERFLKTLKSKPMVSCENIVGYVSEFADGSEQQDDVSIVLLNCLPLASQEQVRETFSTLAFNLSLSLNAKQIKQTDPVYDLVNILSGVGGLKDHRSNIFLLLSEAYNNSLDHGVLGLDSNIKLQEDGFFKYYEMREKALAVLSDAMIIIDMRYCPDTLSLYFIICDSGRGFNRGESALSATNSEFGRGLSLLKEIAEKVTYNASGNQVEMCYKLS